MTYSGAAGAGFPHLGDPGIVLDDFRDHFATHAEAFDQLLVHGIRGRGQRIVRPLAFIPGMDQACATEMRRQRKKDPALDIAKRIAESGSGT